MSQSQPAGAPARQNTHRRARKHRWRRIANRRSFPFVASYHGAVYQAIENSAAALIQLVRSNTRPLDQILTKDVFRELFSFLADEPDLLGPIAEIFDDAKKAGGHLLKVHHRLTRQIGRFIFWMGARSNGYLDSDETQLVDFKPSGSGLFEDHHGES